MLFSRLRQATTILPSKKVITQKTPLTLVWSKTTMKEQAKSLTVITPFLTSLTFLWPQLDREISETTSISRPPLIIGLMKTEFTTNIKPIFAEPRPTCWPQFTLQVLPILADSMLSQSLVGLMDGLGTIEIRILKLISLRFHLEKSCKSCGMELLFSSEDWLHNKLTRKKTSTLKPLFWIKWAKFALHLQETLKFWCAQQSALT